MKRELLGGITSRKRFAGKSDFSAKQVSTTLLLLLLCMLMPQGVKAKEFNYPFADLAAAYSDATDNYFGNYPLTLSSTSYSSPSIANGFYGVSTTYGNVTVDFSKFAFRSECNGTNQGKGWYLCNSNRSVYVGCGLFVGNGTPEFAITNLKNGDVIEVSFRGAADKVVSLGFVSGNAEQNGSALANGAVLGTSTANNITTVTFTSTSKGDIIIKANGISDGTVKYTTYLTNIKITRPDVASYNYDPAKEVYDLTQVTNGDLASNNFADADFQLNNTTAQYLTNLSGGVSTNNRIAVTGTSNWTFDGGLKQKNDWEIYNLSITNLKADDRVRITYQDGNGNWGHYLDFGSDATGGSTALNSAAFKDNNNNGELDTDEDEHMITRDEAVDKEVFYTMTEDGHLDLIVFAGVKITKIEIYSDHQAVMLDRYNGSAATGYTAYFESTGQLMAKEHIVPGGLNVYVGNSDETQHAEVVCSDQGPVSYVYDQAHFKMARHATFGSWNVASELPVTGTFYKFIPEVSGTMSVRFKAYSVHYNNIQGDGSTEGNEVATDAQCPYYLMVAPGENNNFNNNSAFSAVTNTTKGTGALVAFNNITVEAGKVYYLYGWWESSNNSCGIAQLLDVTFIADNMITPLAKWVASGTTSDEDLADATGFTTNDLHIKKMSSNITSCEPYIENNKLKIRNIVFAEGENPGGTILIKLGDPTNDNNPVFAYTIAYDASYRSTTWDAPIRKNDSEGHTWDFSTNPLRGLKWNNTSSQADDVNFGTGAGPGLLYDEMHETLNGEPHSDWTFEYRVKKGDGGLDPMYLNKYNMEGDNADMMWDTEGLIFNTGSNQSAINNEYTDNNGVINHEATNNTADPDRYVGILPGGQFIIPKLKKDDRVIIYMGSGDGSGAEAIYMNIENALDAIGNPITEEYRAGGSLWNANSNRPTQAHGDRNYRGAYHFIAKADGDMVFTLENKGTLAKLYKIELYSGQHRHTNDAERVQYASWNGEDYNLYGYQYTNSYNSTETVRGCYSMHYRGKGQILRDPAVIYKTGNVTTNIGQSGNLFMGMVGSNPRIFYKSVKGDFGMFRMRVDEMNLSGNYVADYGLQNINVGYIDKVDSYPYTWDFTDLMKYAYTDCNEEDEETRIPQVIKSTGEYDNIAEFMDYTVDLADQRNTKAVHQWKWYDEVTGQYAKPAGYGLHIRNSGFSAEMAFPTESQLYAGDEIIAEAQGLDFIPYANEAKRNGRLLITDEGIALYEQSGNYWRVKIPEVPSTAAVYVRAKQIGERAITAGVGAANTAFTYVGTASDDSGDMIYAVKGTGADMTLFLSNIIVKKIAISTDAKTVNHLGYATESRAKEIDPELMGYMTGTGLKAYTVNNVTYGDKASITLTEISPDNLMGSSTTNDHKAYIIYNNDAAVVVPEESTAKKDAEGKTKAVDILDGGFHLFVPDMHDMSDATDPKKELLVVSDNMLVSRVDGGTVSQTETIEGVNYTNYLMNYKYNDLITGERNVEGKYEAFYRASANASLGTNKAYLRLPTEKVNATIDAGAKFAIIFVNEEEGTETTSLDGVKSTETLSGDNAIYTLSGVKVSKPEKGGIYVKNGKKFIVK